MALSAAMVLGCCCWKSTGRSRRRCRQVQFSSARPWASCFLPDVPVLRGNFAPTFDEFDSTPCDLIEGHIPKDFPNGAYLRIGPNPRWVRPLSTYHWFDGDGMVHRMHIKNGSAHYSNRWVRTAKFVAEDKVSFPLFGGMAAEKNLLKLTYHFLLNLVSKDVVPALSGMPLNGNCNTSLASFGGKLLALQELSLPHELDPVDLSTRGLAHFGAGGEWTNEFAPGNFSAHPHVCPTSGEMIWASYRREGTPQLCYGVISPEGEQKHFVGISYPPEAGNCIAHDIVITQRHSIVVASPLQFTPQEDISPDKPLVVFDRSSSLYFGVMPRYGTNEDIIWIPASPGMVFHFLNAYEEGNTLKVLGFRFGDFDLYPEETGAAFVKHLPYLVEWTLDLKTHRAAERTVCADALEFPAMHPLFLGKPQSIAFASTVAAEFQRQRGSPHFDGAARVDLRDGAVVKHQLPPGTFCGEWSFVPRPNSASEDDGWLVGFTFTEGADGGSEFRILDAQNLEGHPVARISLPGRVPYGFHGIWLQD